jgi:xanthine dehydrogenase accessory factor
MSTQDPRAHAEELRNGGSAFVLATVVRAERPTSAKPGAHAVVHADGTMVGFVGGDCAQASVRTQALATLASGEPLLLRITPDDDADGTVAQTPRDGELTVHNPCLSGGILEVFLEPNLPARRIVVHGTSPIAVAFADLARYLGYRVDAASREASDADSQPAFAVVVASHGDDEAVPLVAGVRAGVAYVGLVASRRRGPEVLSALDLSDEEKARIRTPAGIDIGARSPQDVAVSIMAEIIATHEQAAKAAQGPRQGPPQGDVVTPLPAQTASEHAATAIDVVCGMTVAAVGATLHADVDGVRYWFCGTGCRRAFLAEPSAFLSA